MELKRNDLNPINQPATLFDNYAEFLESLNISFIQRDYYLQIGIVPDKQGWVFYIPLLVKDIQLFFMNVYPFLSDLSVGIKIPVDKSTHISLKEGHLGIEYLGKVMCIFPRDSTLNSDIATKLIEYGTHLKGTPFPTGIRLGNILYTRYDSFEPISTPEGNFLIDNNGNYVKDNYSIPYQKPNWVEWEFKGFTIPTSGSSKVTFNSKYNVQEILRDAPKGRVMKGLYSKGFFRFKHCLIKEGRAGMFSDDQNRDICDRLLWQKNLHEKLSGKLAIPSYIDYFVEEDNTYLVLDFISGTKFETYIETIFLFNSWLDLPPQKKVNIIEIFLQMVDAFALLHKEGYVHRDITITNFLVDKKGKLYLIDLELAYALFDNIPYPPFQVGTDGYMSPEQEAAEVIPSCQQDIFSLGATIMTVLVRLAPKKLINMPAEDLFNSLRFFCGSETLANLLVACLNADPELRPGLVAIRSELITYKLNIPDLREREIFNIENISDLLRKAIAGLQLPVMLSMEGYWVSQADIQQKVRYVYVGFQRGISGIIYLISLIKNNGFYTDELDPVVNINWRFLEDHYLIAGKDVPPGFYNGSYGVALSIAFAIKSGLLPNNNENLNYLNNCLLPVPEVYDIENGLAGYGIVLLKCRDLLDQKFFDNRLSFIVNTLLQAQHSDGFWYFQINKADDKLRMTGLENGTAGIIIFLLEYYKLVPREEVKKAITNALLFLERCSYSFGDGMLWPYYKGTREGSVFVNGSMGIVLTFIRAYEIFPQKKYKQIAEKGLLCIPDRPITNEYNFSTGITGWGEVFLEAYRVFNDEKWYRRSEWLAGVFMNSVTKSNNTAYWIQNISHVPCADLMVGNGSIIHFLMRFLNPFDFNSIY